MSDRNGPYGVAVGVLVSLSFIFGGPALLRALDAGQSVVTIQPFDHVAILNLWDETTGEPAKLNLLGDSADVNSGIITISNRWIAQRPGIASWLPGGRRRFVSQRVLAVSAEPVVILEQITLQSKESTPFTVLVGYVAQVPQGTSLSQQEFESQNPGMTFIPNPFQYFANSSASTLSVNSPLIRVDVAQVLRQRGATIMREALLPKIQTRSFQELFSVTENGTFPKEEILSAAFQQAKIDFWNKLGVEVSAITYLGTTPPENIQASLNVRATASVTRRVASLEQQAVSNGASAQVLLQQAYAAGNNASLRGDLLLNEQYLKALEEWVRTIEQKAESGTLTGIPTLLPAASLVTPNPVQAQQR